MMPAFLETRITPALGSGESLSPEQSSWHPGHPKAPFQSCEKGGGAIWAGTDRFSDIYSWDLGSCGPGYGHG